MDPVDNNEPDPAQLDQAPSTNEEPSHVSELREALEAADAAKGSAPKDLKPTNASDQASADADEDSGAEDNPPWGDEDFDPNKAWKLIQNLRKERDEAKTKAKVSTESVEEAKATASLTDEEAQSLRAELEQERSLRTKQELLHEAGLPLDLATNLSGKSKREWSADVKKLLALRGGTVRVTDPAQGINKPKAKSGEEVFADALTQHLGL